jgi:hypothetical protein
MSSEVRILRGVARARLPPDWTDGVNDVPAGQFAAAGDLRVARLATAEDSGFTKGLTQLRAAAEVKKVMRRLTVLLAICVLVLPAVASANRSRAASSRCPPTASRVLRADRQAVLYKGTATSIESQETPNGGYEHYAVHYTVIRGCLRGAGRSFTLGQPASGEGSAGGESGAGIQHETLRGEMVAYEDFVEGCGLNQSDCSGRFEVVVCDLRTGKTLHDLPTGTRTAPNPNFVGVGFTTEIVVKADGAVAWITEALLEEGAYQVHALDKTGSRMLASGPGINPNSLALHGSELSWSQDGKRMSTPLS